VIVTPAPIERDFSSPPPAGRHEKTIWDPAMFGIGLFVIVPTITSLSPLVICRVATDMINELAFESGDLISIALLIGGD